MNPAIFREYDVRGVAERDFDAAFARDLGRAFGALAIEAGKRRVSVGRDCRLTSDGYAAAVADGIASTGLAVIDATTVHVADSCTGLLVELRRMAI